MAMEASVFVYRALSSRHTREGGGVFALSKMCVWDTNVVYISNR